MHMFTFICVHMHMFIHIHLCMHVCHVLKISHGVIFLASQCVLSMRRLILRALTVLTQTARSSEVETFYFERVTTNVLSLLIAEL